MKMEIKNMHKVHTQHLFGQQALIHSIGTFSVNKHLFIQLAHFRSQTHFHLIDTFLVNKPIFIQQKHFLSIDTFSFNRLFFDQQAPFGISNMKDYDLSIDTFWYTEFEGLFHFQQTPFGIYIYICITTYLIYTIQTKLETQHSIPCYFPPKTNK